MTNASGHAATELAMTMSNHHPSNQDARLFTCDLYGYRLKAARPTEWKLFIAQISVALRRSDVLMQVNCDPL